MNFSHQVFTRRCEELYFDILKKEKSTHWVNFKQAVLESEGIFDVEPMLISFSVEIWMSEDNLPIPKDTLAIIEAVFKEEYNSSNEKKVIEDIQKCAPLWSSDRVKEVIQKVLNLWSASKWFFDEKFSLDSISSWFNIDLIRQLHCKVCENFPAANPGVIRVKGKESTTGNRAYALGKFVHNRLQNLVSFFVKKSEEYPAEFSLERRMSLACVFFVEFLNIHPFVDGNGRVARLLFSIFFKNSCRIPLCLVDRAVTNSGGEEDKADCYIRSLNQYEDVDVAAENRVPTEFADYAVKCLCKTIALRTASRISTSVRGRCSAAADDSA